MGLIGVAVFGGLVALGVYIALESQKPKEIPVNNNTTNNSEDYYLCTTCTSPNKPIAQGNCCRGGAFGQRICEECPPKWPLADNERVVGTAKYTGSPNDPIDIYQTPPEFQLVREGSAALPISYRAYRKNKGYERSCGFRSNEPPTAGEYRVGTCQGTHQAAKLQNIRFKLDPY